jgi:hypothetical protein
MDWPDVARGALWILGLSIALAAWSYAYWWARQQQVSLRRVAGMPMFTIPFFTGLALFSAALAWGLESLWLRVVWAVVGAWCLWQVVRSRRMAGAGKHIVQGELDETH